MKFGIIASPSMLFNDVRVEIVKFGIIPSPPILFNDVKGRNCEMITDGYFFQVVCNMNY